MISRPQQAQQGENLLFLTNSMHISENEKRNTSTMFLIHIVKEGNSYAGHYRGKFLCTYFFP